jgi:hypothetical protein
MVEVVITKSNKPDKKMKAIINGKKTVHFGASGMSDYTKHHDDERKQRYIDRHKKRENWGTTGYKTAGFWSKQILWNKKTLKASVDDLNQKFQSLKVKLK